MLALLILFAAVVLAVVAVSAGFGRQRRFNEVERFHRASRMTTEWSRNAVTKPVIPAPTHAEAERDRTDA